MFTDIERKALSYCSSKHKIMRDIKLFIYKKFLLKKDIETIINDSKMGMSLIKDFISFMKSMNYSSYETKDKSTTIVITGPDDRNYNGTVISIIKNSGISFHYWIHEKKLIFWVSNRSQFCKYMDVTEHSYETKVSKEEMINTFNHIMLEEFVI